MKLLGIVVACGLLLSVVAAFALDRVATRLLDTEENRARLRQEAARATGRQVDYGELDVRIFPPSLVVRDVRVAGETPQAPALVEADALSLRVALLPLLARVIVVDSLVLEGASMQLVRTDAGLLLPEPTPRESGPASDSDGAAAPQVAVRSLALRDAHITYEDRTLSPPLRYAFALDAQLEGEALDAPFDLELALRPDGGGSLEGGGEATLAGQVDLAFDLDELDLAPFGRIVGGVAELAGRASGELAVKGSASAPENLSVDLSIADARIRSGDVGVAGPVSVTAEIEELSHGSFEVDASDAALELAGGAYRKEPGRPAKLTGRFVPAPAGELAIDDLRLSIENVNARGKARIGTRSEIDLATQRIELAPWAPMLREHGVSEPSGALGAGKLRVATAPLRIWGEVPLEDVSVRLASGEPLTLRGRVSATGDAIRVPDAELGVGAQTLPVRIEITDLADSWSVHLQSRKEKLETQPLLAALSGPADRLSGLLSIDTDLRSRLVGPGSFTDALDGRVRFGIEPGVLRGISILEATLRQLDATGIGGALRKVGLSGNVDRGLEPWYGDEFETMTGTLDVSGGLARTPDFRLVTRGYVFSMKGTIALADLGLDAEGELQLGRELTQALTQRLGIRGLPTPRLSIPIPKLTGTLSDPKPQPDFRLLWRLIAGNLPGAELGAQGVDQLLRGLGGLLGKGREEPAAEPEPDPGAAAPEL